ncbi:innexin inx2-like [Amphibalanus amphitrite]|uniref:innexin inx2-like n=1 Tax=Amphibalanus amphitrite TaxID=1232801 RepID=UPI001C90DAC4|nr:innexin inx2-like [Amphibalanus amphitrite]
MALSEMFADISRFIKGKGPDGIRIDNHLFQLHYRLTTFIFFASSTLLCASSLFGNPVTCHHADPDRISNDVINTYCWVTSTYTLPHLLTASDRYPTSHIAYHGVGAHAASDERRYHGYYQWVAFVLFLQGVAFYVPHWLWKLSEGRRLASLLQEMHVPVVDAEDRSTRLTNTVRYLRTSLGSYSSYLTRFVLCELLNVANVIANIFITDRFLGGQFLRYGPRVLSHFITGSGTSASPMSETFPKLTKCNFQLVGGSGSVETIDSVCVMPLNILNEKIYMVLWFWLALLAVASVLAFTWRVVTMSATALRVPMLRATARLADPRDVAEVVERLPLGDFFLLTLLAKNMDSVAFRQLMSELARELGPASARVMATIPKEIADSQTLIRQAVEKRGAAVE